MAKLSINSSSILFFLIAFREIYSQYFVPENDGQNEEIEGIWEMIKRKIERIVKYLNSHQDSSLEQKIRKSMEKQFNSPMNESLSSNLLQCINSLSNIQLSNLKSEKQEEFCEEFHKIGVLCLILTIQSPNCEYYIQQITHLDQFHQETIMRTLERMGISNSPMSKSPSPVRILQFNSTEVDNIRMLGRDLKSSLASSQGVIFEQVHELQNEKIKIESQLELLKSQQFEEKKNSDKLQKQLNFLIQENQQLRDELIQYELMETKYKSLEKEVKGLKSERERILADYKWEQQCKQEEIEILKEQLLQKTAIESKAEEYKNKFEYFRDLLEQKNNQILLLRDQTYKVEELTNSNAQLQKLNTLLKNELSKENEGKVEKDQKIKELQFQVDDLQDKLTKFHHMSEKKEAQLKEQSREVNQLKQKVELLNDKCLLESQNQDLDMLLTDMREKIVILQNENKKLKNNEDQAEKFIKVKASMLELEQVNQSLFNNYNQLQRKVKSYEDKIELLMQETQMHKDKLNVSELKEKLLEEKNYELQKEKINFSLKSQKLEKDLSDVRNRVENSSQKQSKLEIENDKLKFMNKQFADKTREYQYNLNQKDSYIKELKEKNQEIMGKFEKMIKNLQFLEQQNHSLSGKLKENMGQNKEKEEIIKEKEREVEEMKGMIEVMERKESSSKLIIEQFERNMKDMMVGRLNDMIEQSGLNTTCDTSYCKDYKNGKSSDNKENFISKINLKKVEKSREKEGLEYDKKDNYLLKSTRDTIKQVVPQLTRQISSGNKKDILQTQRIYNDFDDQITIKLGMSPDRKGSFVI